MPVTITPQRPDSPEALALIVELEAHLAPLYPPESQHGLSVEKLVQEGVAFFVVYHDGRPAGCGGVKLFEIDGDEPYGEVKRMYIRPAFRRMGLAKRLLGRLGGHARQNGVGLLRLETGIYQADAIGLYESWGFERIPPFGEYRPDPLSIFYEKRID